MFKLTKDMKIVCACRGGQVRSVAARRFLCEDYGFRKVLSCGLERNDEETLRFLFDWADVILIVGSVAVHELMIDGYEDKQQFLHVGKDVWGNYQHPELMRTLGPIIEGLVA